MTDTPTLEAHWCFDDYTDLDADEAPCVRAPSDGDWSAFAPLLEENDDDMGAVVLARGDDVVRIVDSLIATVQNLCLGAIPDLVDRKHVVVPYFMLYGYIRMDPEASDQLVLGDELPTVRYPRAELIPALVEIGRSYLEYLETCRADDSDYDDVRAGVRTKLAAAESALETWDGT